jgi:hypothetical protein
MGIAKVDWAPFCRREPIGDHGGEMNASLGLVEHVTAGRGDPFGWWNRPEIQASSHFYVPKVGNPVQYVPLSLASWAQAGGNYSWHSVETEGMPTEILSDNQIHWLVEIWKFCAPQFNWRPQLSESPMTPGFGWHGMGGAAWGGHYGCPGNLRKSQRATVLKQLGIQNPNRFAYEPIVGVGFATTGEAVKLIQYYLNAIAGQGLIVDGVLGPKTTAAMKNFQKFFGLVVDGVFGNQSWATLDFIADQYEIKHGVKLPANV